MVPCSRPQAIHRLKYFLGSISLFIDIQAVFVWLLVQHINISHQHKSENCPWMFSWLRLLSSSADTGVSPGHSLTLLLLLVGARHWRVELRQVSDTWIIQTDVRFCLQVCSTTLQHVLNIYSQTLLYWLEYKVSIEEYKNGIIPTNVSK